MARSKPAKTTPKVADGQEPDADELDAVLLDNNKSIEDLKQDVELLIRRRELRRVYDQLPALSKERAGIEKQIEEANQVLKVAEDKHEALVEPLLSPLQQIKQAVADADRAQTQLVDSCAYGELSQQLQDVRNRLTEAHTRRQQLEMECSSFRDWIAADRHNATRQRPLRPSS